MYNIDYNLLLKQLTPIPLRKPKFLALVKVLCGYISVLYADFLELRKKALYELSHGSQVIYLEKYLNDRFCPSTQNIKIIDGQQNLLHSDVFYLAEEAVQDNPVLYTIDEDKGPVLYLFNEYTDHADFIIQINNTAGDCTPDLTELRSVVDLRKLPGITYDVEIIVN